MHDKEYMAIIELVQKITKQTSTKQQIATTDLVKGRESDFQVLPHYSI